jgi:nitrogenase-associated protein
MCDQKLNSKRTHMAKIIFYEKIGCDEHLRQKSLLAAAGYEVEARSLTGQNWTPASLRGFFAEKPVAEWFDRAAPKVLSGQIDPSKTSAQAALVMLSLDPDLIASPLIKLDGLCAAGLDAEELKTFLEAAAPGRAALRSLASRRFGASPKSQRGLQVSTKAFSIT